MQLLDEAVARFEREFDKPRPFYECSTVGAFSDSYDENLFADLDEQYFDLDTYGLQVGYIRAHLDEFASG